MLETILETILEKTYRLQMFEIYEDLGIKDPQALVENLLRIFDK